MNFKKGHLYKLCKNHPDDILVWINEGKNKWTVADQINKNSTPFVYISTIYKAKYRTDKTVLQVLFKGKIREIDFFEFKINGEKHKNYFVEVKNKKSQS